jgi:hypothetical protein
VETVALASPLRLSVTSTSPITTSAAQGSALCTQAAAVSRIAPAVSLSSPIELEDAP